MTKDEAIKKALTLLNKKEWEEKEWEACDYIANENQLAEILEEALAQPEQEPVAWEGGEGWESLAWELCADENGEDSCNELIWEGGPIPEPWGDRWMKYEEEAKRLIALVQKHTTPPQRKPLTDELVYKLWDDKYRSWIGGEQFESIARAVEAKLKERNT